MNEPEKVTLTQEEINTYHEEGLVIPNYQLPAEMLDKLRASFEKLQRANPHLASDNMVCPHIKNYGAQLNGKLQPRVYTEEWMEYASFPDILDIVEQLIGPDFLLWGSAVFGKPAGTGKEVPWHQDGEYWPIKPLATTTVWLALDDSTSENGCLRYIPGSHKRKEALKHHKTSRDDLALSQVLNQEEYDESQARDIILKAGQLSLHDVYVVHGSMPNRSDKRRAGLTLRFMPTTSHFDHEYGAELAKRLGTDFSFSNRPLYLMRGIDRCGKNDFIKGHYVIDYSFNGA